MTANKVFDIFYELTSGEGYHPFRQSLTLFLQQQLGL